MGNKTAKDSPIETTNKDDPEEPNKSSVSMGYRHVSLPKTDIKIGITINSANTHGSRRVSVLKQGHTTRLYYSARIINGRWGIYISEQLDRSTRGYKTKDGWKYISDYLETNERSKEKSTIKSILKKTS
jgi:hypothetical protein